MDRHGGHISDFTFCNPSSELYIAEHFYEHSALPIYRVFRGIWYVNRLYIEHWTSCCHIKGNWNNI